MNIPFVMQLLGFPRTVASSLLEQFCILCFLIELLVFLLGQMRICMGRGQIVSHKGYSSFSHAFFLPKVVDNLSSNARDSYLFLAGFLFRVAWIVCL